MAHSSAELSSNSAPSSISRNSSCYIEIREYRFSKDELRKKGYNTQSSSPYPTSRLPFAHPGYVYPVRPLEYPHSSDGRGRPNWKVSGLYTRSSEYEDIYNRRIRREDSAGVMTPGRFGRHSFREGRDTRRHGGITGEIRHTRRPLGTKLIRDTGRTSGKRNPDERRKVGKIEDIKYNGDIRDSRDTTDIRHSNEPKNRRERKDARNSSYIHNVWNVGDANHSEKEGDARNSNDSGSNMNTGDIRDRRYSEHIEEMRNTRGTSSPPDTRGDSVREHSNTRATRHNINNGGTNQSVGATLPQPRNTSENFASNRTIGNSSKSKLPPPVLPKPVRSRPPIARPNSPAQSGSTRSNLSDVSSYASQNTAATETGVVSAILDI